jgi:hypothetical protein
VLWIVTKRSQNDTSPDASMGAGGRVNDYRQWANIDGAFDHPINARIHYNARATHDVANIPFVVINCRLNNHRRINVGRHILEQDTSYLVKAGRCTGAGEGANGQTNDPYAKEARQKPPVNHGSSLKCHSLSRRSTEVVAFR